MAEQKKIYVPAGTYEAEILETGITSTAAGLAAPYIKFNIPKLSKTMTWFGSLKSDEAANVAAKQSLNAGFIGSDWDQFSDKSKFVPRELNIVVGVDDKGKSSVNFINVRGGQEVKKFTGSIPKMANKFAELRKEAGLPQAPKEEIPF